MSNEDIKKEIAIQKQKAKLLDTSIDMHILQIEKQLSQSKLLHKEHPEIISKIENILKDIKKYRESI